MIWTNRSWVDTHSHNVPSILDRNQLNKTLYTHQHIYTMPISAPMASHNLNNNGFMQSQLQWLHTISNPMASHNLNPNSFTQSQPQRLHTISAPTASHNLKVSFSLSPNGFTQSQDFTQSQLQRLHTVSRLHSVSDPRTSLNTHSTLTP